MFKGKTTRIIITGRAREKFEKLNAVVENEIKKRCEKEQITTSPQSNKAENRNLKKKSRVWNSHTKGQNS